MVDLAQFTRGAVQQALNALERTLGVNPIPGLQDTDRLGNYIQEYSDIPVSRNVMAGALFNKL